MSPASDQTPAPHAPTGSGFWYDQNTAPDPAVEVLEALRTYRAAEQRMRRDTREGLGMGENDLAAMRVVHAETRLGRTVSPSDLARRLGITTASATLLADRLVHRGHVVRRPHLADGRRIVLEPAPLGDADVRRTFGAMHERMREVAATLTDDDRRAVIAFLARMTAVLGEAASGNQHTVEGHAGDGRSRD